METNQECILGDFEFSADDLEFLATTYSTHVRDLAEILSGYKLETSLKILRLKETYLHLKNKHKLSTARVIHYGLILKSCGFSKFCQDLLTHERTPLHYAINAIESHLDSSRNTEIIQELVDLFEDLSHKDRYGYTPLHLACREEYGIVALYMIQGTIIGSSMEENKSLDPPFQSKIIRKESGQTFLIHFSQDNDGNTPLHLACHYSNSVELVECLLEYDYLSMFTKNNAENFPLEVAYQHRNFKYLNILLQKKYILKYKSTKTQGTQQNPDTSQNAIIESYLHICKEILHNPVGTGNAWHFILDAIFEDIYKNEEGFLPVETWLTRNLHDNKSWYLALPDISHEQMTKILNKCLKDIEVRLYTYELPHKVPAVLLQQVDEMLLEYSSDIKVVHCIRFTEIYYRPYSLLKYSLLSSGIDTKNKQGRAPFDEAYRKKHFTACAWLMVREQCSVYLNVCETNAERCRAVKEICTSTLSSFPKHCMIDHIVPGDTLLHVAASIDNATELIHYLINVTKFDVSKANSNQEYPLHIACRVGNSAEVIKLFLNCDLKHRNMEGDSPFDLLFIHHHYEFAYERALTLYHDFPTTVWNDLFESEECQYEKCVYHGMNTPLHIATRLRIKIDTFKQTNSECFVKWSNQRNMLGELPIHLATHNGDLDILKFLCNSKNHNTVTNKGNTAVHELCMHSLNSDKDLEVLRFLHGDLQCNTHITNCDGQTALHICCQRGSLKLVEYLLEIAKLNPNVEDNKGSTPLMLISPDQHEVVRLLIQHGANPSCLYKQYKQFFENYSSKDPPPTPLNVIVVGNHTSGKSTVIEALKSEHSIDIVQAEPLTAGIIPSFYQSNNFGTVMWYDLAGHSEYYASHEAVMNTVMSSSLPLVLLLVDIRKTQEVINQEILYWLQFLQGLVEPKKFSMQPHIAVVFSFRDELQGCAQETIDFTRETLRPFFEKSSFDFVSFSALDCRRPGSDEIKDVRSQIQKSYSMLCDKTLPDFLLHCFYAFLLGNFKNKAAVTIQRVLELMEEWIATGIDPHFEQEDEDGSDVSVESFNPEFEPDFEEECPARLLPKDHKHIFLLCEKLRDKGHVMIVLESSNPMENSWIIINKDILLKEINGSLFAPENFKQHYKNTSTSTGVVTLTKLSEMFSKYESVMLSGFLTYLEFCNEISDNKVLQLLQVETESCSDRYFFFPGLVSIEKPDYIWNDSKPSFNKCGWILQTIEPHSFFTPRVVQVLLLRLAFSHPLSCNKRTIGLPNITITRRCSIWKNGLFWQTEMGLDCLIEVIENSQAIILMLRTADKSLSDRYMTSYAQYRSGLIRQAFSVINELCSALSLEECFIHPDYVCYPPIRCEEAPLYSIRSIAKAICENYLYVPSTFPKYDKVKLTDLLIFEPFTLSDNFHLFNTSFYNKEVSSESLQQFTASPVLCAIYCQWRSTEKVTYGDLRELLGKYSIFGGRDPQALGRCEAIQLMLQSSETKGKLTLPMLIAFNCKDGKKINILEKVGVKYYDFGVLLLNDEDGSKVNTIEHKHMRDPKPILTDIVKLWLQGEGNPASWTVLIGVLDDIGLTRLAEEIHFII